MRFFGESPALGECPPSSPRGEKKNKQNKNQKQGGQSKHKQLVLMLTNLFVKDDCRFGMQPRWTFSCWEKLLGKTSKGTQKYHPQSEEAAAAHTWDWGWYVPLQWLHSTATPGTGPLEVGVSFGAFLAGAAGAFFFCGSGPSMPAK